MWGGLTKFHLNFQPHTPQQIRARTDQSFWPSRSPPTPPMTMFPGSKLEILKISFTKPTMPYNFASVKNFSLLPENLTLFNDSSFIYNIQNRTKFKTGLKMPPCGQLPCLKTLTPKLLSLQCWQYQGFLQTWHEIRATWNQKGINNRRKNTKLLAVDLKEIAFFQSYDASLVTNIQVSSLHNYFS